MTEIGVTEAFVRSFGKLPATIRKKADAKTNLFQQNPFHPSLRTKKLKPHQLNIWSFWIDRDYRIKFRFVDSGRAHFLLIGDRKDIYR